MNKTLIALTIAAMLLPSAAFAQTVPVRTNAQIIADLQVQISVIQAELASLQMEENQDTATTTPDVATTTTEVATTTEQVTENPGLRMEDIEDSHGFTSEHPQYSF